MAQPVQVARRRSAGASSRRRARHRQRLRERLARRRGPLRRRRRRRRRCCSSRSTARCSASPARVLARDQPSDTERGRPPERARGTPYVAIVIATVIAFGLAIPHDLEFLAGTFAFGAMIAFAIAHLSLIVLRFRSRPGRARSACRFSPRARRTGPAAGGSGSSSRSACGSAWSRCTRGRASPAGSGWRRGRAVRGLPALRREAAAAALHDPAEALQEREAAEYGSILVPVFGEEATTRSGTAAGWRPSRTRTARVERARGAVRVRDPDVAADRRAVTTSACEAKAVLARAKEVGEEYEGVEVATAMVRGRTVGQAIVRARRRGVEAIVLAAEEPTRVRGGAILGGRGRCATASSGTPPAT